MRASNRALAQPKCQVDTATHGFGGQGLADKDAVRQRATALQHRLGVSARRQHVSQTLRMEVVRG